MIPDTGAYTPVTMNIEDLDTTGTMHDVVTNNHRLVAPRRGLYAITVQVKWGVSASPVGGYRAIRTSPGLIASVQPSVQNMSITDIQSASGVMLLDQGGTVGLEAATTSTTFVTGIMSMRFISPFCPAPTLVCATP